MIIEMHKAVCFKRYSQVAPLSPCPRSHHQSHCACQRGTCRRRQAVVECSNSAQSSSPPPHSHLLLQNYHLCHFSQTVASDGWPVSKRSGRYHLRTFLSDWKGSNYYNLKRHRVHKRGKSSLQEGDVSPGDVLKAIRVNTSNTI